MKLLITREELLERTPINGNVDTDKIIPNIITAQDTEVQLVLGTNLYNKIVEDNDAGTITGDYKTLLDTYIKPMLCQYSAAEFYLFHAFEIANGGIYRHQSENSFTPEMNDINKLSQEQKNKGIFYRERLISYLCYNTKKFPEYVSNQDSGIYPDRGTANNSWVF